MSEWETFRAKVYEELKKRGFRVSPGLPYPDLDREVRPPAEIAARLMALDDLFTWAGIPEKFVESEPIQRHLHENGLREWLTEEECKIVDLPRIRAYVFHNNTIGWKLENMWPLAWALGFEDDPDVDGVQMDDDVIHPLLFEFLPDREERTVESLLSECTPQPPEMVAALEYAFYCAHNAVRSAQMGRKSVPKGFDPVSGGGVIHERRHALTWCVSPGVGWDETDLST